MVRINKSPAETALSRAVIRWGLARPILIAESADSAVYRVGLKSGANAALKLFKPGVNEEIRGTILLTWYGGQGAAEVYDATPEALLMEYLPGPSLAALVEAEGDDEAADVLASTVAALHAPRSGDIRNMVPIEDRFQALVRGNPRLWPGAVHDLFARAVGVAINLLDTPYLSVPLHGDLRHENILKSPRGWLALDPKGLLGDPLYDLAPSFLSPVDKRDLITDPRRIDRLANIYAASLGAERGRILRFAAVHAALVACWALAAGEDPRHPVSVLERVLAMLPDR